MAHTVHVFPQANTDLGGIGASILTSVSRASAKKWVAKLRPAIDDLAETAEQFPEADEAAKIGNDLRMRIVGNRSHVYRILFTIVGNRVFVHRVRHAAQDDLSEDDL